MESSLFFKEVGLSPRDNHVPREKEFKLPQGTTSTFFLLGTIMPSGRNLSCPKEQPFVQEKGLKLLMRVAIFFGEQMCPIFLLIITFAYES